MDGEVVRWGRQGNTPSLLCSSEASGGASSWVAQNRCSHLAASGTDQLVQGSGIVRGPEE